MRPARHGTKSTASSGTIFATPISSWQRNGSTRQNGREQTPGGRPSTPCTTPFHRLEAVRSFCASHHGNHLPEFFRKFEPEPSLHLTRWPQTGEPEEQLLLFGERLKENLSTMRREKTEKGFPRAEMGCFPIHAEEKLHPLFKEAESDLLSCSHAESLKLLPL